ncbi:hypothetical protein Cabys_617 [Caldithrix abyssi DSM 13497]|uniref:Uncharacterized protein n=1 Tax=Caldithrix abyssi DSM 13497 TaxID=880073 RepID=A0A1J1C651_CALAY|nr:hypothetical protein Cabys_617 [Caldithrix abyssi DSM 13497]
MLPFKFFSFKLHPDYNYSTLLFQENVNIFPTQFKPKRQYFVILIDEISSTG